MTTIMKVTIVTKMTTFTCQVTTTKNPEMTMPAQTNIKAAYMMNTLFSSPKNKTIKVRIMLMAITRQTTNTVTTKTTLDLNPAAETPNVTTTQKSITIIAMSIKAPFTSRINTTPTKTK